MSTPAKHHKIIGLALGTIAWTWIFWRLKEEGRIRFVQIPSNTLYLPILFVVLSPLLLYKLYRQVTLEMMLTSPLHTQRNNAHTTQPLINLDIITIHTPSHKCYIHVHATQYLRYFTYTQPTQYQHAKPTRSLHATYAASQHHTTLAHQPAITTRITSRIRTTRASHPRTSPHYTNREIETPLLVDNIKYKT